jgi:hypothetical protein
MKRWHFLLKLELKCIVLERHSTHFINQMYAVKSTAFFLLGVIVEKMCYFKSLMKNLPNVTQSERYLTL